MTFSLRRKNAQRTTPSAVADALALQAERWANLDPDDLGAVDLMVAASVIRELGEQCRTLALKEAIVMTWLAVARRDLRTYAARSAAELASQASTIASLQAEIVQLKANNAALTAVASRPAQSVVEVAATLEQRDSRTRHLRDATGELVESQTTYE